MYKIGFVTSHHLRHECRDLAPEKVRLHHLRRGREHETATGLHIIVYFAPGGEMTVLKNIFSTPGLDAGDSYPDPLPFYKWISTLAQEAHPDNDRITLPGGLNVRRDSDEYRAHVRARDEAVPVDYERGKHKLFKTVRRHT